LSAIIVLIVRILMALALFGFLAWAIYTIWRDLNTQTALLQARKTPTINLAITNMLEEQTVAFAIPEVIIGRSPACAYTIHNETVSSTHARLSYHHDQWWVEDLRSTNGTFVNDEKVATPTVLMSGDDLRCGQVTIRVNIDDSTSHA
jgi:pSer/pThr/pTyr-binding forkhead associated (FHA) protein